MATVTPQALTRTVQDFLSEAAGAVVLENGAVAFDLAQSKYSISGEYNRCLLHLWSAERNSVRTCEPTGVADFAAEANSRVSSWSLATGRGFSGFLQPAVQAINVRKERNASEMLGRYASSVRLGESRNGAAEARTSAARSRTNIYAAFLSAGFFSNSRAL